MTKISIVLLYIRIFPCEVSRNFNYICYAVVVTLAAYLSAMCIFFGMQCEPISFFWKQWDGRHTGRCINYRLGVYVGSGVNIAFDLVVFFLPAPRLLKLQVKDKRRKIGVVFIFLVGLFVTVCSIIRLQYLAQIGKYANATYHYNEVGLWSGVEADVGVICAPACIHCGPDSALLPENSREQTILKRRQVRITLSDEFSRQGRHGYCQTAQQRK